MYCTKYLEASVYSGENQACISLYRLLEYKSVIQIIWQGEREREKKYDTPFCTTFLDISCFMSILNTKIYGDGGSGKNQCIILKTMKNERCKIKMLKVKWKHSYKYFSFGRCISQRNQ